VGAEILDAVAQTYKRGGPLHQQVAVRSFLESMHRETLEETLAVLLDTGTLLARPGGTVVLSVGLRASLLTKPILTDWVNEAWAAPPGVDRVMLEGIRSELRELLDFCQGFPANPNTMQRAAQFSAVLTMADLNPAAIDVVAGLPERPQKTLEDLAHIPEGTCRTIAELNTKLRTHLVSEYTDG
jgi:hypothetical protein